VLVLGVISVALMYPSPASFEFVMCGNVKGDITPNDGGTGSVPCLRRRKSLSNSRMIIRITPAMTPPTIAPGR
jgi:hypothetical protein